MCCRLSIPRRQSDIGRQGGGEGEGGSGAFSSLISARSVHPPVTKQESDPTHNPPTAPLWGKGLSETKREGVRAGAGMVMIRMSKGRWLGVWGLWGVCCVYVCVCVMGARG